MPKLGWGIIVSDHGDACFIHHRAIEPDYEGFKDLKAGERVEFLQVKSERGYQAMELYRLEEAIA